jgi:hypothetical protein
VLGYDPMSDDNGVDPLGHGSTAWMQELDPAKPLQHAMHVDVSVAHEHVEARLAAALAAGGRVVDDSGAPGGWILADRAGKRSASPPGRMGLARPGPALATRGDPYRPPSAGTSQWRGPNRCSDQQRCDRFGPLCTRNPAGTCTSISAGQRCHRA